jgi:hypothetical protein
MQTQPETASQPAPLLKNVSNPKKKVIRTKEDIQRERDALLKKTTLEIDLIIAEYHARLPMGEARSIGAIYGRYSSRFQDSIADQFRTLLEAAYQHKIFIPREYIFFDMAVRGFKDNRPGLKALRAAIREKRFEVFLVFSTSRLFRRTYKALQFVEEELVERGIRGIFVKSHLDTADGDNWRTTFQLLAAMDEAMVRTYGAHVQAAHEGLFVRGMICTSLPVGYTGEEVPGELTKRKRPRRRIVIDQFAKLYIEKIFIWYVVEGKTLSWIARELNDDDDAPPPAKSLTGLWTQPLVRDHLKKTVYRGWWEYGAKEAKWSSERDYAKQVPRPEPLKSGQFDDLRVISDEIWYRAQELLAQEKGNSGRKSYDGDRKSRPRMLRGLFICPEHERQLVVGGVNGKILFCPLCRSIKPEKRPLFSHLNRAVALQRTCETLAGLVRADEELVSNIITACQRAALAAQQPDPKELTRLKTQVAKLDKTIQFNRRNPGETDQEQRATEQLIRQLRRERDQLQSQISTQQAAIDRPFVVPKVADVEKLLAELADLLMSAASAEDDAELRLARRLIDELTGGRIELYQMGEREAYQGWLQGRFQVDLGAVAVQKLTGTLTLESSQEGQTEVVIDYQRPRVIDEQAEKVMQLWHQGLLYQEIGGALGLRKSRVTKLVQHWFDSRGLPRPNGHRRRAELEQLHGKTPEYQQIADKVVELAQAGHRDAEIARQLHVSDTSVAKAHGWWYKSRRLPVPTTAERRDAVLARAIGMIESGRLIRDIAREVGYSARGLTIALKKYLGEKDKSLPDGRKLRGNARSGHLANGSRKANSQ